MWLSGKQCIGSFLALTLLVMAVFRPPGTMLAAEGETVTYVLCMGGELKTVTMTLDGEGHEEADQACDFFARQIADLTIEVLAKPTGEAVSLTYVPALLKTAGHPAFHVSKARAPPCMS